MTFLFDSYLYNAIALILSIVVAFYLFAIGTFNYWKKRNVKFVEPVPFFGNTMATTLRKKSVPISHQEIYNSFSKDRYVGMYMFRTPLLMIRDPVLVHSILTKDFSSFYDRGITVDERLDLLSLHLVNLRGWHWKSLRSKLMPAFSSGKLKGMSSQLEECANTLAEYFESLIPINDSQNILEIMAKFATDVIGSCAFGLQFNSLKDPDSQFRKMGQDIFKPSMRFLLKFIARTFHPSLPYYLNLKAFSCDVEKFFLDFVKDAVRRREENPSKNKDFMQLLIELRNEDNIPSDPDSSKKTFVMSDPVMASNAFVFFIAGFETTSSTMGFFLLELAANPKIQDSVKDEIIQVLDKYNGELSYETTKDLAYTDMVISETLRKYPIGSALLRECTQNYPVPDSSFVIEKGTKVLIPVYSLHHDPDNFPDPECFDPERFSPENKGKIKHGTYLPFGDGPRICIGLRFAMMEMKYAFCKIIPKYEFSLSEKMVFPVRFKKGAALLAPEDGILLNIHKRSF